LSTLPTTHHLLPYEKHAAARLLRRQAARADNKVVKGFQERWGPEGTVLLAAANSGVIWGVVCFFIGVPFVAAWGGRGAGLLVFYILDCIALAFVALSVVRNVQRKRAIKRFQASRPEAGKANRVSH
jgi:Flp pilus assembly protein TadB